MRYTDLELINKLIDYNKNIGYPTQRGVDKNKNMPSSVTYFNRFGSFQNALDEACINTPENRLQYKNREIYDNEDLLNKLRSETEKYLKNNKFLAASNVFKDNKNLAHVSTYNNKFGGICNAFKKIGYDISEYNKEAIEKDIIDQYRKLCIIQGKTLNSREITRCNKQGLCYSTEACLEHFRTLNNFQIICGHKPTNPRNNKTEEDMINDIKKLHSILGRTPMQLDLIKHDFVQSASNYFDIFGSWRNVLKRAGFKSIRDKYAVTKTGTRCLSYLEYVFFTALEESDIKFQKEEYYKDHIKDDQFKRRYRFDCKINFKDKDYFIEIFGIVNNAKYDNRKKDKIDLCNKYNLPLIIFEKGDLLNKSNDDIVNILYNKINKHK